MTLSLQASATPRYEGTSSISSPQWSPFVALWNKSLGLLAHLLPLGASVPKQQRQDTHRVDPRDLYLTVNPEMTDNLS